MFLARLAYFSVFSVSSKELEFGATLAIMTVPGEAEHKGGGEKGRSPQSRTHRHMQTHTHSCAHTHTALDTSGVLNSPLASKHHGTASPQRRIVAPTDAR